MPIADHAFDRRTVLVAGTAVLIHLDFPLHVQMPPAPGKMQ